MGKVDYFEQKNRSNLPGNSDKKIITGESLASGFIHMKPDTVLLIKQNETNREELIKMTETAGIKAAGKLGSFIPVQAPAKPHQIKVKVDIYPNGIEVRSHIISTEKENTETEALSAVCFALLTIFEMFRKDDSSLAIDDIKIIRKT